MQSFKTYVKDMIRNMYDKNNYECLGELNMVRLQLKSTYISILLGIDISLGPPVEVNIIY